MANNLRTNIKQFSYICLLKIIQDTESTLLRLTFQTAVRNKKNKKKQGNFEIF